MPHVLIKGHLLKKVIVWTRTDKQTDADMHTAGQLLHMDH